MSRNRIPPLVAATHLRTVVQPLREIGAPLERLMEFSGLPVAALNAGDTMVSELAFWRLQDLVAAKEGMPDFGYRCAIQDPMKNTGHLGGLRLPPPAPLAEFLTGFRSIISRYSNHANHQLARVADGLWYTCDNRLITKNLSWQVEQYLVGMVTKLVRLAAGDSWLPCNIWLTAKADAYPLPDDWAETTITYEQTVTGVFVPNKIMRLPVHYDLPVAGVEKETVQSSAEQMISYLMPLVLSGNENLEFAAASVNLSPRSLQRRLTREGLKYRELVSAARLRNAKNLLANDIYEMQDMAALLGYAHAADFSTFFKRMSGVTPSEFAETVRS